jgi:hypothetical protein
VHHRGRIVNQVLRCGRIAVNLGFEVVELQVRGRAIVATHVGQSEALLVLLGDDFRSFPVSRLIAL